MGQCPHHASHIYILEGCMNLLLQTYIFMHIYTNSFVYIYICTIKKIILQCFTYKVMIRVTAHISCNIHSFISNVLSR